MDDNTVEIRDDEINVEEIMAKIRENIHRRQAAGELPSDPNSVIGSASKNYLAGDSEDTIQHDLSYVNSNWDIHNNSYFISSHHPLIGKFLVKGRQMIHGEVRRYVDPMISHQTEFNSSSVRIITRASQLCTELDQHQQELDSAINSLKLESDKKINSLKLESDKKITDCIATAKNELDSKIDLTIEELTTVKSKLDSKIELTIKELFARMDVDIRSRAWLAHVLEERVQKGLAQKSDLPATTSKEDTNYFRFEDQFRGSREDIKQRQLAFLPYFEKSSRVLDIGCGRGEFLEILKDHDIGSIGVDSNRDMVAYCRSHQLDVEHSDAIAYLERLEDKSLDGIFMDQVVEHLEPEYLIRLLALCHQKMKFGYHIVVETVNPLTFVSLVNFYADMTHKKPLHPETLLYILSVAGFRECEKKFFSLVSDEGRLKKVEGTVDMNETERKSIEVYNHNVEMLNIVLFGAQDYAVIGKK
jgi:O-antigen chain-terminating methyltransferase